METLYLVPGNQICKKGLPGGKIECKKGSDPLPLKESYFKVIEKNIFHFKKDGKILDQAGYDKFMTVEEVPVKKTKKVKKVVEPVIDEAFEELKRSAVELEIEFDENVSFEDLTLLVEDGLLK